MKPESEVLDLGCARAMAHIHRRLDGDALDPVSEEWTERHLALCATCRDTARELEQIQRALRDLPALPLPEAALGRVWDRTVRADRGRGWFDWRGAAAAAVLTGLLGGLWYATRPQAPSSGAGSSASTLSAAELARGAAEARFVLRLTSAALRRGERVAIDEVLGGRVAPALSKIPIVWPSPPPRGSEQRRKGDDDA